MEIPNRPEAVRLAALRRLEILDSPREKGYDDIVRLASYILDAPVALVTMLDENRNWFKACVGLGDLTESPREISFCTVAIEQPDLSEPLVIPDATADPRFCNNPLVTGPLQARMYVGVPLVTRDGQALGTLCVFDVKPRQPTAPQIEAMKTLAGSVVSLITLREAAGDLRESEERNRLVVDNALDAAVTLTGEGTVTAWNRQAELTFGWGASEAVGKTASELGLTEPAEPFAGQEPAGCTETPGPIVAGHAERTARRRDGSSFPAEFSTSSICTRDGRLYSTFVRDISDRKLHDKVTRDTATRDVAIFALARLAESRDPETGAHLERVQSYCKVIAEHLAATGAFGDQIDGEFVDLLHSTSPLHDIGKVGIPDGILLKPGRLSDDEFDLMKLHTTIGAETLDAALLRFPGTPFLMMARQIAASHHERFDGSGYPNRLAGTDIPLAGRIVAVVDVFDALSSKRVYKEAFTFAAARGLILKDSGTHFDPLIVKAFEACQQQFKEIRERYSETATAMAA
jgi:PAS domain S-box-containing protein